MSYSDFASKEISRKLVLCHIEPSARLINFGLHSGAVYSKTVDHFVLSVHDGQTAYTKGTSTTLSASQWFFNNGVLYIRTDDDSDPKTKTIVVTYRLFFANAPLNLPWDLSTGYDVEYQGRLKSSSPVSQEIDDEQVGIALETSSNLTFYNNDGYFDDFYDILFFENKNVYVYSWNDDLAITEVQKIFEGVVQDKTFSTTQVVLQCKDFVYKLREPVALSNFTESDGEVPDSYLGTPKRKIFGQFKQLQCVPIDATLAGFSLTGTISGIGSTITGTGTSFLDELSPDDEVIYSTTVGDVSIKVLSVDSNTQFTASDELDDSIINKAAIVNPAIPWRKKNRRWHIAGHKLRAPATTVATGVQPNRFIATDSSDIFTGDLIEVDGEEIFVQRVNQNTNEIALVQNLQGGTPSPADVVTKNPISKAFIGGREIFVNRDWTNENTTEAVLVLDNLAEFNLARKSLISASFSFTNGSRTVSVSGVDLKNEIKPRDWISSDSITHTTYYEILSVSESSVVLRTAYAGTNYSGNAYKKNVEIVSDDTNISVNCIGLESGSVWINSPARAVKYLIENDAGILSTNATSFTESHERFPYSLSLAIPETLGSEAPTIKETINIINQSCFGSLASNSDWELFYSISAPDKPSELTIIEDHDIVGTIAVKSKNEIVRKVNCKYRHFFDIYTSEKTTEFYEFTNIFVDNYIGVKTELDIEIYLYDQVAAESIAQRYAFYNSLSQSNITFKSKLQFMLSSINDKVYLNLRRLYKRFGNQDRRKLGVINKITKDGENTTVEINDLGNIFNRVPSVLATGSSDFSTSSDDDRLFGGYVVDTDLEIPDVTSENEFGQNLIG